MAMWWIENNNGWFYIVGKCVMLCEYVLHIFHENTYNDIHDGKRKFMNYFLVSTKVFISIIVVYYKVQLYLDLHYTKFN